MKSTPAKSYDTRTRRHFLIVCGCVLALAVVLVAWPLNPAKAQSSPAQKYQLTAGDRIGVTVFGQPDLSGEATVDESGNIHLPIIGDVHALNLTLSDLEGEIAHALAQGYIRNPSVSVRISEFTPVYVVGMVRVPGVYPYREGMSVLGAIARAGGLGLAESQQVGVLGTLLQAEERVRLLEINRAVLLMRRARLVALQNGDDQVEFPDMSGVILDPARLAQIRNGEQLAFTSERQALQQQIETLEKQLPRLEAEIASLNNQIELELQQRSLNHELVENYDQLAKSGLARKATYIEVKREEARIDENVGRLKSDALKAELSVGDVQVKIAELRNEYQRRVTTELRETDRSLLESTVTIPAANRLRATLARQVGLMSADQVQQPAIVVIRAKALMNVKYDAAADFPLRPGDVVQIGSLIPPALEPPAEQPGPPKERAAQGDSSPRPANATAASEIRAGAAPAAN